MGCQVKNGLSCERRVPGKVNKSRMSAKKCYQAREECQEALPSEGGVPERLPSEEGVPRRVAK